MSDQDFPKNPCVYPPWDAECYPRKRFLVVGGIPFRSYSQRLEASPLDATHAGTGSFTSLRLVGATDSYSEVQELVDDNYEACGGLIEVFDLDHLSDEVVDDASESPEGDELGFTEAIQDEEGVDESDRVTLENIPAILDADLMEDNFTCLLSSDPAHKE
jgi:hypothetical protein